MAAELQLVFDHGKRHELIRSADEMADLQVKVNLLADAIEESVDVDRIVEIAQAAPKLAPSSAAETAVQVREREEAPVLAVARDAAESQRSRVAAAGMELSVELCVEPVVRRVDADAVSQIVVNLIDNAVKYAACGGRLDVSVTADGTIVVADRGPGVPGRDRERVFERFYRCDDSLAAKSSGSGLGLSIARRLAEGMGGRLVCAARDGGGAEFRLSFGG